MLHSLTNMVLFLIASLYALRSDSCYENDKLGEYESEEININDSPELGS